VHHLVCTDGSKGSWDADVNVEALAARRQLEQREAARRLAGERAGEVRFLEYVDGELDSGLEARGRVARVIRELRPTVVLGHDPWKRYRLHPDHRHAGFLACEGVVAARDPHFFTEHRIEHHRPSALLLWEADEPDHVEDVSGVVDVKLAALEAHESQFESTMKAVDDGELDAFRDRIGQRLAALGEPHGIAAAEVFKLVDRL
jgi:LmbE family N-acetylglucosaminyl deacetylase